MLCLFEKNGCILLHKLLIIYTVVIGYEYLQFL